MILTQRKNCYTRDLFPGRTWTLNQVGTAMKEVLTASAEMVDIIPIPVLRLCLKDIQNRLPPGVEPLDNSVFAHFVVCALYDMTQRMAAVLKREGVCPKVHSIPVRSD